MTLSVVSALVLLPGVLFFDNIACDFPTSNVKQTPVFISKGVHK